MPEICVAWLAYCKSDPRPDMTVRRDADSALKQWLDSRFLEAGSFGLVAEYGGFAGFLIGRICDWESVPPVVKPRRIGLIDALYVGKDFRERGIGSTLLDKAVDRIRAARAVAVETTYDIGDEASARIWRRARFEPWMVHAYRML